MFIIVRCLRSRILSLLVVAAMVFSVFTIAGIRPDTTLSSQTYAVEVTQNPEKWGILFGTAKDDNAVCITSDRLGNQFICYLIYNGFFEFQYNLVKIDENGVILWDRIMPGSANENLGHEYRLAAAPDGGVFICDVKSASSILYKLDSHGVLVWTATLPAELAYSYITAEDTGCLYVAGVGAESLPTITTAKYDNEGNQLWVKPSTVHGSIKGIAWGNKDSIYIYGGSSQRYDGNPASAGSPNYFLLKMDSGGNYFWIRQSTCNEGYMIFPSEVAADGEGNAYITHFASMTRMYPLHIIPNMITKYSSTGSIVYSNLLPKNSYWLSHLAVDPLENAYVTLSYDNGKGVGNGYRYTTGLIKYDYAGQEVWQKTLDTDDTVPLPYISALAIGKGGDIYACGAHHKNFRDQISQGNGDAFLVRYEGDDRDSDEDGLLDSWETYGLRINGEFLDLPAMGADPYRKDIFVEVDYMTGHQPKPGALEKVQVAFANAPVTNLNGRPDGIALHVDSGPESQMNPVTSQTWGNLYNGGLSRANEIAHADTITMTEVARLKNSNMDAIRRRVFHYCIFAHAVAGYGSAGGLGQVKGTDFIISLGLWPTHGGTSLQQAGTFMHELGHNLGLGHGGPYSRAPDAEENYKPNYLSIMNYSFCSTGLLKDKLDGTIENGYLDYSRFSYNDIYYLDEAKLNEKTGMHFDTGISGIFSFVTLYYSGANVKKLKFYETSVDWNNISGIQEGTVSANINGGPENKSDDRTELYSYNDWLGLNFKTGSIGKLDPAAASAPMKISDPDTTYELYQLLPHFYAVGVDAPDNTAQDPGDSVVYSFTVTNSGDESDTFDLNWNSGSGWADLTGAPSSVSLLSGESQTMTITVTVPGDAAFWLKDELKLTAQSRTAELVSDCDQVLTEVVPTQSQTAQKLPLTTPVAAWPAICGNNVVFLHQSTSTPGFPPGIYLYNLVTGEERALSVDDPRYIETYTAPDIYENLVVWGDWYALGKTDLFLCDRSTGIVRQLTTHGNVANTPRIYGSRIVYRNKDGKIYVYDLTTDTEQAVTDAYLGDPVIYEDKIAWAASSGSRVYLYDLTAQTQTTVYTSSRYISNGLDFDDNKIVWSDSANGNYDIYLYDLNASQVRQITTDSSDQYFPAIDGDLIAWRDIRNGYSNSNGMSDDIYVYDLAKDQEIRLTPEAGEWLWPDIDGSKVVWQKSVTVNYSSYDELYMIDLATNPLAAPATTVAAVPAAPDANGWYTGAPALTLSVSGDAAATYYQWDATDPDEWISGVGPFLTPEGTHTLNYYSIGRFGNNEPIRSAQFKVDSKAPATALTSTPALSSAVGGLFEAIPQITLTADDTLAVIHYRWDGSGEWQIYGGSFNGTTGDHLLEYFATDIHGNAENIRQQAFRVDLTADHTTPATTLTTDPVESGPAGYFESSPFITLTADESAAAILYQWDQPFSGTPASTSLPTALMTGTYSLFSPDTFGPTLYLGRFTAPMGQHTLYYYTVDAAGNIESTHSKVFYIGESITIYSIEANPASLIFETASQGYIAAPSARTMTITNTGNQSVTIDQPDTVDYVIEGTFPLVIDPGAAASFTIQPKTGLDAGTHQETIAIDGGNGASTSVEVRFTVESVYIERTLTDNPTGISIHGTLVHKDAVLSAGGLVLDAEGVCAACDAIRARMASDAYRLVLGKDISLSLDFVGSITITLPVTGVDEGETLTVLHCQNGVLDQQECDVGNGRISFAVNSLSPVAVFAEAEEESSETSSETSSEISSESSSESSSAASSVAESATGPTESEIPDTGETPVSMAWMVILLLALAGFTVSASIRRSQTDAQRKP